MILNQFTHRHFSFEILIIKSEGLVFLNISLRTLNGAQTRKITILHVDRLRKWNSHQQEQEVKCKVSFSVIHFILVSFVFDLLLFCVSVLFSNFNFFRLINLIYEYEEWVIRRMIVFVQLFLFFFFFFCDSKKKRAKPTIFF